MEDFKTLDDINLKKGMKYKNIKYRGFRIIVSKKNKRSMWLDRVIYRVSDEWILVSGLDIDSETKREAIEECKRVIDEFLENGAS